MFQERASSTAHNDGARPLRHLSRPLQAAVPGDRRILMDESRLHQTGFRPSAAWTVVAVLALVAAGCAQPSPASGPGTSATAASEIDAVASTTVVGSSSTSAPSLVTSSTLAGESTPIPPKPDGEPQIELLPVVVFGEVIYDPETGYANGGEVPSPYFVFEAVSGQNSYTVAAVLTFFTADGTESRTQEAKVGESFIYFAGTGDFAQDYEGLVSKDPKDPETWVRVDGEWTSVEADYLGLFTLSTLLPEVSQAALYKTFATMKFTDWDLIDGAWYARYTASPEFVTASLGFDEVDVGLVDTAGDVWVSPLGFMHSYVISAGDGEGSRIESTWRLSDLGTTTVETPNSTDASLSTTSEIPLEISTLEELLTTEFWDPTVLLDGQSFRWRGRSQIDLIDLDLTDDFSYSDDGSTQEFWGSVGSSGIERERGFAMDPDTRAGGEFVQFDGTSSKRFGTFSLDGVFSSDDDWFSLEFEARPRSVAFGSLSSGYLAYNGDESSEFEIVGVEEIDGLRVTHLRSVVSDGVALASRVDATFDFWVTEGSPEARVVKMTYTTNWQRDDYSNGIVVGQTISERSFEVYDVGDDSILIESP